MPGSPSIEDDYYAICLRDLENRDDVIVNHYPMQEYSRFWRLLYRIHNCRVFNNKWWRLGNWIWFPYVFKNTFKNNKPICFVCIRYPDAYYLLYLRKKYPNCKIVFLCRDLLKNHIEEYNRYQATKQKVYDYWMTFDEGESKQYGFKHFDEFESKLQIPIGKDYPIADVFFTGRAKDRLPKLVEIYDKLTSGGLRCLFIIMSAPKEIQVERDGIKYIDKPITYTEMLRLTVNCRCILDLNQADCVGYTSRILEAIIYNKKLVTDNMSILSTKFYNPQYVQCVKTAGEIDTKSVKEDDAVDYHYNNEFSPLNRLSQIDKMLCEEK